MTSLAYLTDGTPLDVFKKQAKALRKAEDTSLSAAQDRLSKERGFQSMAEAVSSCVVLDRDEQMIRRKAGLDTVSIDLEGILDIGGGSNGAVVNDGSARIYIDIELEHEVGNAVFYAVTPRGRSVHEGTDNLDRVKVIEIEQVALWDATENYHEDRYADLIRILGSEGLFDLPDFDNVLDCETDALAAILLRDTDLTLGDRMTFNIGVDDVGDADPFEADPERGAFPMHLSDGSVAVSNGAESPDAFKMVILDEDQYAALLRNMEEMEPGCTTRRSGQNLMHDALLSAVRSPKEERDITRRNAIGDSPAP